MNLAADIPQASPMSDLELEYAELLKKLPSRAPIYLPTEKIPIEQKISGVKHVIEIYKETLDKVYRPRLRALREKFKDKERCFLIGNGPSLNSTDLSVLADEVTFAVNGFFLKAEGLNWKPTFYCVEDHLVAEDRAEWINNFKGPIKFFPAYLGYMFPAAEDTIFYNHRPRKSYPHGFDFSLEADKITYTGCTVTFSLMQLAAYLGFKKIYLIGVDASYSIPADAQSGGAYGVGVLDMKSDDPNHFDPNYFGKGFRWHDPQVEKMVEAYAEARKTLTGTPQTIYNATIGGALEVFERRSFHAIFPHARSAAEMQRVNEAKRVKERPRLLVLDMTPIGNGTATGEIKANILADWPESDLLQVARHKKNELCLVNRAEGAYRHTVATPEQAMAQVRTFDPDAILYRPLPDSPELHAFSMACIREIERPLVSWIMDDWMRRSAETEPETWSRIAGDLREVLDRSQQRLSICDAMNKDLLSRYGLDFTALANGIDPADWIGIPPRPADRETVLLRYAGGMAADMNRASVLRVAEAVERVAASGRKIRFEISTQPWWKRETEAEFAAFKHTRIELADKTIPAYRMWLAQSDINLIAYNFDEASLRYIRTSFGNKTPDCMAAGVPILAHGPLDTATIRYLAEKGCAAIVERASVDQLISMIVKLTDIRGLGAELGARARRVAFAEKNIGDIRRAFHAVVTSAAATRFEKSQPTVVSKSGAAPSLARETETTRVIAVDPDTMKGRLGHAKSPDVQFQVLQLTAKLLSNGDRSDLAALRQLTTGANSADPATRHALQVIEFFEGKQAISVRPSL